MPLIRAHNEKTILRINILRIARYLSVLAWLVTFDCIDLEKNTYMRIAYTSIQMHKLIKIVENKRDRNK